MTALTRVATLIALAAAVAMTGGPGWPATTGSAAEVLMFHGDPERTGWNAAERQLTPAAMRSGGFGRLWRAEVDGAIYAEPLVAANVSVRGAAHTAVYVVTEHDSIYAFDGANGVRLWGPVSLGTPVPRSTLPCGNIDPVGFTSTPVIDRAGSTLYAAGLTTPDGGRTKAYKLTAVDLGSGVVKSGFPVAIAPPVVSGIRFDPGVQQQRGALTVVHGAVYIPFGGYWGDCAQYHGWVVGAETAHPQLQQAFVTPTHREGGIWATGGIAADAAGNLYAATGNSDSDGAHDLGNSIVRLATSPRLAFSGRPADFFTPSNWVSLNASDTDLGSAVPLVLPAQAGSSTPDLLFAAGKQGVGYLVNRAAMGGITRGNGIDGEAVYSRCIFGDCRSGNKVFSAAAYWDGGNAGKLIVVPGHGSQPGACRGSGGVIALRLEIVPGGASSFRPAWCGPSMRDAGAPAISGPGPDGGIVWVIDTAAAALYALDARSGDLLYHTDGADSLGQTRRFITPAVADGRVYVGAEDTIAAYGLVKP